MHYLNLNRMLSMGRSIYCSTCKQLKELGRDNESRCKSCKSEANKEKRALKRKERGQEPFGTGRNLYCYECKALKERRSSPHCNACHAKIDSEWRLKTGRTKKKQTGLCPCGNKRAPYCKSYCIECIAIKAKEWRKKYPYTEEQKQRRNELQNMRYRNTHEPIILKDDEINIKRRMKYHNPLYIEEKFKHQVRSLTRSYIKSGKLIKDVCEECGTNEDIEAHHDDYYKPLDIRWLCKYHHMEHHKEHGS